LPFIPPGGLHVASMKLRHRHQTRAAVQAHARAALGRRIERDRLLFEQERRRLELVRRQLELRALFAMLARVPAESKVQAGPAGEGDADLSRPDKDEPIDRLRGDAEREPGRRSPVEFAEHG
jgi:hypothetical protein